VKEPYHRPSPLEQAYPSVARWVKDYGWIEIGRDQMTGSFVRALDEGGLVWQGDRMYTTVDDTLQALEAGLAEWMHKRAGE